MIQMGIVTVMPDSESCGKDYQTDFQKNPFRRKLFVLATLASIICWCCHLLSISVIKIPSRDCDRTRSNMFGSRAFLLLFWIWSIKRGFDHILLTRALTLCLIVFFFRWFEP